MGAPAGFFMLMRLLIALVRQQVDNNMVGTSGFQSFEERRPSKSKEGGRFSMLGKNDVTSLVNTSDGQRVFKFINEMRFMPFLKNMITGRLQEGDAVFTENSPVFANSICSFPLRSSFVQEHGSSIAAYGQTDMGSSGPAWTVSLFSFIPMNQYASPLGNFENRNDISGSGSLPMVQAIYVSSVRIQKATLLATRKFLRMIGNLLNHFEHLSQLKI